MYQIFSQEKNTIEYTYLGKFQAGEQFSGVDLPYYKPKGITQIPSRYFNALVLHQLVVDSNNVKPTRLLFSSDESVAGIYIDDTEPEESYNTLRMYWFWSNVGFSNQAIKNGLFFRTSITGHTMLYNIPYGAQRVSLLYSIRFLIYDNQYELINTINSEKMGVCWELEWNLPEAE